MPRGVGRAADGAGDVGDTLAGECPSQPDVERDGARMRFDDAVGAGGRLVTDVDGAHARWFAEHGVIAALQRPDSWVRYG